MQRNRDDEETWVGALQHGPIGPDYAIDKQQRSRPAASTHTLKHTAADSCDDNASDQQYISWRGETEL